MERGVLHERECPWPTRCRRVLVDRGAHPIVGMGIGGRELVERKRLADALAELVGHDLELREQAWTRDGIAHQFLEATIPFLPLPADGLERDHGAGDSSRCNRRAAIAARARARYPRPALSRDRPTQTRPWPGGP